MKADDFRLVVDAINVAVEHTKEELLAEVNRAVEFHRRAVWVRDEWCCKEMTTFASHFWCAPRPKRDYEWGTELHIRGARVNYCPFCGVFVGRATKEGE